MLRWFIIDKACDVDINLYEIYPVGRLFSFFVYSPLEILPGDVILVKLELYYTHVVKLVRNGVVLYDFDS